MKNESILDLQKHTGTRFNTKTEVSCKDDSNIIDIEIHITTCAKIFHSLLNIIFINNYFVMVKCNEIYYQRL